MGTDYVQLGKYHVKSRFGIIVKCNSPDFNGVDGILGLGLPPDVRSGPASLLAYIPVTTVACRCAQLGPMSTVPRPLLFQLTDSAKASDPDSHILKKRIFSFMSSDGAGELQLGGVDPNSIDGELMLSPTIGAMDYRVPVFGMWYGKKPLLDYVPHDPRLRYCLPSAAHAFAHAPRVHFQPTRLSALEPFEGEGIFQIARDCLVPWQLRACDHRLGLVVPRAARRHVGRPPAQQVPHGYSRAPFLRNRRHSSSCAWHGARRAVSGRNRGLAAPRGGVGRYPSLG